MEPITGTLGIVGVIVFIITAIDIMRSSHSALGKLGWIAVAFFLSIIGSILWLLLGRNKK
jgi:hypothetical protein